MIHVSGGILEPAWEEKEKWEKLGQPASDSRFENKDAKFEKALSVNANLTADERRMRVRACFRSQSGSNVTLNEEIN